MTEGQMVKCAAQVEVMRKRWQKSLRRRGAKKEAKGVHRKSAIVQALGERTGRTDREATSQRRGRKKSAKTRQARVHEGKQVGKIATYKSWSAIGYEWRRRRTRGKDGARPQLAATKPSCKSTAIKEA